MSRTSSLSLIAALVLAAAAGPAFADDAAGRAAEIRRQSGIRGGLVVHLGCGDGQRTAALAGESYLVHGLAEDPAVVANAREMIRRQGSCVRASVDLFAGKKLPYADNLVQLLVADSLGDVPMAEVMRVLSPGGAAWIAGKVTRKARPAEIDEWTHYLHDASNNAVADDTVVDQPGRLQWVAGPKWARSHDHLSSTSAMVSAGGRIFAIVDEAPAAAIVLPAQWTLVARDAFSGVLLWKRPIRPWEGHLRDFRSGPTELARRLVAVGDRVYVTLGYGKPVTALDAATGEVVATFEGTDNALEIICRDGKLFTVIGDRMPDNPDNAAIPAKPQKVWYWWAIYKETPPKKRIMAFDAETARPLWQKDDADTVEMMPTTLSADGGRVFFQSPKCVIALDEKTGKQLWRAERPVATNRPTWSAPTLVVSGDVVLSGDRAVKPPVNRRGAVEEPGWVVNSLGGQAPVGELIAFSAESGERLWACPCREVYNAPPDVLVAGGLVWTSDLVGAKDPGFTEGRDLHTGKVVRTRPADPTQFATGMHHRCYRNKATQKYLILGRDGTAFVDIATGKGEQNAWVRGACQYGVMPCNGLLYAPAHSCACNIEIKLDSFLALAPRGGDPICPVADDARLDKGEAYGKTDRTQASRPGDDPTWPTYRHDAARSGKAGCAVPDGLGEAWSVRLSAGRITSPVAADGKVFVACLHERRVVALDAATGKQVWSFTAGGPIDSPPTIHDGLVIFGCADGRIYCLRADDGKRAWTYLAAPLDRRVVACGRLESAWPVSGSVLVLDGVVYAVAGRSTYLDSGMVLCGLDPHTGGQVVRRPIEKHGLPDVLAGKGESIFLRGMKLDKDGTLAAAPPAPHLFSPAGFLDGSWWHRTYWLFGTKIGSRWGGWPGAGNQSPAGRLLVADGTEFYGFGRMNQYNRNGAHPGMGQTRYRLYACTTKRPEVKAPAAAVKAPALPGVKAKPKARKPKPKRRGPAKPEVLWSVPAEIEARGMVLAEKTLYVAGPPDFLGRVDEADKGYPYFIKATEQDLANQQRALTGQAGARVLAISAETGEKIAEAKLPAPPVFDGMIAAHGRLYVCTMDGRVACLGAK